MSFGIYAITTGLTQSAEGFNSFVEVFSGTTRQVRADRSLLIPELRDSFCAGLRESHREPVSSSLSFRAKPTHETQEIASSLSLFSANGEPVPQERSGNATAKKCKSPGNNPAI